MWILGTLLCLVRLARAHISARRIVRAARAIGHDGALPFLESHAATGPFTYGLFRPSIVMPAGAAAWTAERRDAVLAHEAAHARRHDGLSLFVAEIACAVYWWHPAVLFAARQARSTASGPVTTQSFAEVCVRASTARSCLRKHRVAALGAFDRLPPRCSGPLTESRRASPPYSILESIASAHATTSGSARRRQSRCNRARGCGGAACIAKRIGTTVADCVYVSSTNQPRNIYGARTNEHRHTNRPTSDSDPAVGAKG
jgi:hypothetical protein